MAKNKTFSRKFVIQIGQYCLSGGAYFWSGYLIFYLADKQFHWSLWWAKMSANLVGWLVNYSLQRYWVFNNKNLKAHQTEVTGRYIVITLVDFMLDYVIVASLKSFGLTPYLGQFASAGFFTFWNYFWYRFWVFPDKFRAARVHTLRLAHRPHGHGAYRRA
jgi:putative flippase GtrA